MCKMQFLDILLKENIGFPHAYRKRNVYALNIFTLHERGKLIGTPKLCRFVGIDYFLHTK